MTYAEYLEKCNEAMTSPSNAQSQRYYLKLSENLITGPNVFVADATSPANALEHVVSFHAIP